MNDHVWQKAWEKDHWSDWIDRGGVVTSAPSVASWGANRLDVFARGQNEGLWHMSWDGTQWSSWEDLGGRIKSDPASVSWGPNRIDCFARGMNDHVWQDAWMMAIARPPSRRNAPAHEQNPSTWTVCRDALCLTPEWVSVRYAQQKTLLICGDTSTSDEPITIEGLVYTSARSGEDNFANHFSYDWCAKIEPDYDYQYSLGRCNGTMQVQTLNDVDGSEVPAHEAKLIEMEWETGYLPDEFRPQVGDRAWMVGRWVFDLGHPPNNTEIHPPQAVAFTRPDRASGVLKTFAYVYGKGTGRIEEPVSSSFYSVAKYNLKALASDYQFDIYLPPRPSAVSAIEARVVEKPYGGPDPVLHLLPEEGKVRVTYPLSAELRGNPGARYGVVIESGWK